MNSMFILIPTAFLLISVAVALFFWAVKSGQYEDLNAEGQKILFEQKQKNLEVKNTDKKESENC